MAIPQIANPETRDKYLNGIFELADAVGFGRDQIVKNATGPEVAALGKIYERLTAAEAKATKYDQAMAKQMQRVRSSKGKTLRPGAQAESRATSGDNSWQRVTSARNKEAQAEAFADWIGI